MNWGAIAAALTPVGGTITGAVAAGQVPHWAGWIGLGVSSFATYAAWMAKSPRDEKAARLGRAAGEAAEAASKSTERPENE